MKLAKLIENLERGSFPVFKTELFALAHAHAHAQFWHKFHRLNQPLPV
jgi:hypothetical protein